VGATRTPSRNGSGTTKPPEGEKGTSYAWGYEGISPSDILGRRPRPSPADLDNMIRVDGWALAMHSALTWPIRRPKWSVVPHPDDSGEAELCRAQLEPLMRRIVAGMCGAVGSGVAFAELVWGQARDGSGAVVLEDVAFRPVSTCRPVRDRNGRVKGFKQVALRSGFVGAVNEEFLVSERKAFVYAHDSTSDPSGGRSAFETAYHYFTDKRKVLFYRFKNLEKFGGPSTHGKTKAEGEKRRAFETAVRDARNGAAVITHPEDEIAVLHVPNPGVAFRQTINDLNFEMAVSALVQWLGYAQEGNSGSYNASEVQVNVLQDVTEGRIAEMQDEARELCRHICEVNLGPDAAVPTIEAESIDEQPKQLVRSAAEMLFGKRPIPDWLAEAITEAFARQMNIDKPEGAETMGGTATEGDDRS
jgi:hypothetical protein